jgi:hypothetical protein
MLLLVSMLADLVSDRLTINALIDIGATRGLDLNAVLINLQRLIILPALVVALVGKQAVLRRLFLVAIGIVTLGLVTSVAALIATFSRQPEGGAIRLLADGFMLWTMDILVFRLGTGSSKRGGFRELMVRQARGASCSSHSRPVPSLVGRLGVRASWTICSWRTTRVPRSPPARRHSCPRASSS